MPLLIDGHNLIGAKLFPDIRLSDEDDEAKLVARLKVWKSRYRDRITVVFDRGITGGRDTKLGGGGVDVIFATDPAQADDLIRRRLRKPAHNLILVTNDRALRQEAFMHGVPTWSGDEFVARLSVPVPKAGADQEPIPRQSPEELAQLEAIFNARYARLLRARQRRKAAKSKSGKTGPPRRHRS